MNYRIICLLLLTFSLQTVFAQQMSWKKHVKKAEELVKTGYLDEAATHFLSAWNQKKSKTELAHRAGQCYETLREYKKAAEAYTPIQDQVKDFPTVGLACARMWKQAGEYDQAMTALQNYQKNYKGSDANIIAQIDSEMQGCALAMAAVEKEGIELSHLEESINTIANEYAPLAFNDDLLYFSSNMDQHTKIFRSHLQNGNWTQAVLPKFPKFAGKHVGHGTFTPDHKRFYFTVCNDSDPVSADCDIYVTVNEDNQWSKPKKMRDYIKLGGTTATQPCVIHQGNTEFLYFSSDRQGGKGGMDIWYMTRHVESTDYDFTLPQNAGAINTSGHEITPFFSEKTGELYFSSNGYANLGGFDILKARGKQDQWTTPENLGLPYNSSADDYYYTEMPSREGGFLSSNRLFGLQKITTTQDDLFMFSAPEEKVMVDGNIYDKSNNSILSDVQIILYELKDNGYKRLLQSIVANSGTYQFVLIPEREFQVEAIKEGYNTGTYRFNTFSYSPEKKYGKAIYMERLEEMISSDTPVFKEESSTASVEPTINDTPAAISPAPAYTEAIVYVNSYFQGNEVTTSAPKLDGTYYKVQIATAEGYDEYDPQFSPIQHLGRLDTEFIAAKRWTRILLSEYYSLSEAKRIMQTARDKGFPEAFIVKYREGNRL